MADYFSQTDLENALSTAIVKGVYDDDHNGVVDTAPMAACIAYGNAMCNSFLRKFLSTSTGAAATLPLETVPDEVKFAALDFGIAYSIRRRPDIIRAILGDKTFFDYFDMAVEQMKRYCSSQQVVPASTGDHATEGGALLNPDSDADGNEECLPTEGRWADLGDFA